MSRILAFDVVPYLKTGTIIVGVNFKSVLLVTDDDRLINIYNGSVASYYEWYTVKSEIEIFENLEDWEQAGRPMQVDKDVDDLVKEIGPQ